MLGSFFFPNKVANRLFKMGWTPNGLPIDKLYFSKMCDALKANGYDADRAANLWDRAFKKDLEARKELRANTGLYGISIFSDTGEWL